MEITDEELKQLKEIELEILDEFVRICNKYSIKYVLSGGTCLGAVRHKGFIPWDDDIDISMLRSEYEKFCTVCENELAPQYMLQNYHTEKNCGLVFGKIRKKGTIFSEDYSRHIKMNQGIWIDIFPYDNVPNDENERAKFLKSVSFLKNLYIVKSGYKTPPDMSVSGKIAYYLAKLLCIFISQDSLINKLDAKIKTYNGTNCDNAFPFGGAYSAEKEVQPKSMLEKPCPVEFEGRNCTTFNPYEKYLSDLYGDYMQLPPENERKAGVHRICELKFN